MKTIGSNVTLENSEQFKSLQFGLKSKNLSHIIGLLRDEIYSDKVLAVIREYSCNAYDANVMAGRGKEPIVVTLPTKLSPEFKVRDFGTGLSMQEVEDIFISYGESTKRNTNDAVGTLGIGSKSGFCYGSNYLVTSYHNGVKTVYNCVLDRSNVGQCLVLTANKMTANDKEGIEITVPVKQDDVDVFSKKAVRFFTYWNVMPTFHNCKDQVKKVEESNKDKVSFEGKDGDWKLIHTNGSGYSSYNNDNSNESVAIMGNIAYPINWNVVRLTGIDDTIKRMFSNNKLIIRFAIGDLQFAPSRESLQYTDYTNAAISKKLKKIVSELEAVVVARFASCKDLIEAMALYAETFEGYGALFSGIGQTFSGKLFWNKITIKASAIENVDHHDAVRGYNKDSYHDDYNTRASWMPIMQLYEMRRSGLVRCYTNSYHINRMTMSNSVGILLLDDTTTMYPRKAVKYLMTKNSWKRIYVFRFETEKARKDAYDKLYLNHLPIVTYNSIAAEVKKTIVRVNRSTGQTQVANRVPTERDVKWITVGNSTDLPFGRWNNCINSDTINLANVSGYYIKGDGAKNCLVDGKTTDLESGLRHANRIAYIVNNVLKMKIDKIYVFGKQVYDTKKSAKTLKNWTLLDDVLPKIDDYISQHPECLYDMAFDKLSDGKRDLCALYSLVVALAKTNNIKDKNNEVCKLAKLISDNNIHNRQSYSYRARNAKLLELSSSINNLLTNKAITYKTQMQELSDSFAKIRADYPMVDLLMQADWEEAGKKANLEVIAAYINKMDGN